MKIQIQNLKKVYGSGDKAITVLNGLNLEVQTGEKLAIIGRSGSGKSTLLSLLSGLDLPSEGHIFYDNNDITMYEEDAMTSFRANNIGIVFQQFHLVPHLTALENCLLPLEIRGIQNANAIAKDMLDKVGLSNRSHHFPNQLSGGECQRVAIARALSGKPRVCLADEPTGNLDIHTGEQVLKLFLDLVKEENSTLIMVTHSMEVAQLCDKKLSL